jgi:membrane associated rhomboid family serine protease
MTHVYTDDQDVPRMTRAVQWILALNIAVYFLQVAIIGAPNMQGALGFSSTDLPSRWWSVVTYMFVHGGFWHLVLNLYALYLFGPRVENAWSAGEFTRFYLLCGLGGWFVHLLFAREALLVGASAAVLGVTLAYAMRWPDDEIYVFGVIPMRVKWLVGVLIFANLIGGIAGGHRGGGVAYLAHLGGLAAAWLTLRTSSSASLDRLRHRVSSLPDTPDETPRAVPKSLPRSRERGGERGRDIDEIVAQSNAALSRRVAPAPGPARSPDLKSDLNSLLDKISQHGIESLTRDERRLLEEKSRELRGQDS